MPYYQKTDPFSYPVSGLTFLLSNPSMWRKVLCAALAGICLSIATLVVLLSLALYPQAQAFGGGHWWSWLLAVMAVLCEALLVSLILLKFVQAKCKQELFVETMTVKKRWRNDGMVVPSIANDFNCCKLGSFVAIVTFPINMIPIAGHVMYAYMNAPFTGWDYMDMYFEAIGMDFKSQRLMVVGENNSACCSTSLYWLENEYMRFGFGCLLLEMIPILGPSFFALTNTCGAALWASDMEAAGGPPSVRLDSKTAPLCESKKESIEMC